MISDLERSRLQVEIKYFQRSCGKIMLTDFAMKVSGLTVMPILSVIHRMLCGSFLADLRAVDGNTQASAELSKITLLKRFLFW